MKAREQWLVSGALWARIEPLLPIHVPPFHPLGCHRRRIGNRKILDGIFFAGLFVLKLSSSVEELLCEHRLSAEHLPLRGKIAVGGSHPRKQEQTSAAQQCQVRQDTAVLAARVVLSQGSVASVMVAVFHPRPVRAAQCNPAFGTALIPLLTRKVVPLFDTRFPAFLCSASASDSHADPTSRKVCAEGFGRFEAGLSLLNPTVPNAGLG
jgi:hypothetical protein